MGLGKLPFLTGTLNGAHFRADTIKYQPHNAEFLAFTAKLVYEKDQKAIEAVLADQEKIKNFRYQKLRLIDQKNAQAMVIADEEKVIVAFRGTDELSDWMANFKYSLIKTEGFFGEIHEGFYHNFRLLWKEVRETFEDFKRGTYKSLWFTGHSLGGALASLAVAALIQEDYPVYGLYTFGQPRVGNREFARILNVEFKDRYFLFINHQDIVTRIPTRKMGYSHAGNLLYFDEEGNLHHDLHGWFQFQHEINGDEFLRDLLRLRTAVFHGMDSAYYPLLQKHNNHNPFLTL
jgi:triacylglycerol lipase